MTAEQELSAIRERDAAAVARMGIPEWDPLLRAEMDRRYLLALVDTLTNSVRAADGWQSTSDEVGRIVRSPGRDTQPAVDIRDLIERSSLGTPEVKAIRATVSAEEVAKVLRRVKELEAEDWLAEETAHTRELRILATHGIVGDDARTAYRTYCKRAGQFGLGTINTWSPTDIINYFGADAALVAIVLAADWASRLGRTLGVTDA